MKKMTTLILAATLSLGSIAPSWAYMGRDEEGYSGNNSFGGYSGGSSGYSGGSGAISGGSNSQAEAIGWGIGAALVGAGLWGIGWEAAAPHKSEPGWRTNPNAFTPMGDHTGIGASESPMNCEHC